MRELVFPGRAKGATRLDGERSLAGLLSYRASRRQQGAPAAGGGRPAPADAALQVDPVFSSNMVLPQEKPIATLRASGGT